MYSAEPVFDDDNLLFDIKINTDGKVWHMWGRDGFSKEKKLVDNISDGTLPVMLGAGLGYSLLEIAKKGPVAVVDKETRICDLTGSDKISHENIFWINSENPASAIDKLAEWQKEHGGLPFSFVRVPIYMRLDRQYYLSVYENAESCKRTDFWEAIKYPKFQNNSPKILFFNKKYFLGTEVKEALKRNGVEFLSLDIGEGDMLREGFVEDLLKSVINFKPDFVLTINHFGLDREGKITELLDKLGLPLASWFVDNPYLILYRYENVRSEKTAIFTYDAGNLETLDEMGFKNVFYLPLATDIHRFKSGIEGKREWKADVSFLGNSMVNAVSRFYHPEHLPESLAENYEQISHEFGESDDLSVSDFLKRCHPDLNNDLQNLENSEQKLSYEALITWEATRQYRLNCVKEITPYHPLIVGDDGWKTLLAGIAEWRYLSSLDYYEDLPGFYPMSEISFNCTSRQMKGAVNQRVFDVPACGGFVITDYRNQMEDLFEPVIEIVSYSASDEIGELVERYLRDPGLRKSVTSEARKRILAEHTYDHRIKALISKMRHTFGGGVL